MAFGEYISEAVSACRLGSFSVEPCYVFEIPWQLKSEWYSQMLWILTHYHPVSDRTADRQLTHAQAIVSKPLAVSGTHTYFHVPEIGGNYLLLVSRLHRSS